MLQDAPEAVANSSKNLLLPWQKRVPQALAVSPLTSRRTISQPVVHSLIVRCWIAGARFGRGPEFFGVPATSPSSAQPCCFTPTLWHNKCITKSTAHWGTMVRFL
jgi:hypothetical protein